MTIKKTHEDADGAAQSFISGMGGVAKNLVGAATAGWEKSLDKKAAENTWINTFVRDVMGELKRAAKTPTPTATTTSTVDPAFRHVEESKLQEIYINLISNDAARKVFENKGYDINQTLRVIENLFEQQTGAAGRYVFKLNKNDPPMSLPDYLKSYYLPKYLTPQQIQSISTTIDPILNRMATTYPNIAKDLGLLAGTVYRLLPADQKPVTRR